jgi:predicted nucleotide-binding protein (sugar kinase/HSP70/actin superfamily)
MTIRRVIFPHMGNYYVATKTLAQLLGDEVIVPPRITKRTLELGAKHSPESACIPFKYTLGNFIEALDKGANVLLQAGGGCRMGFYGEVQKAILKKLGYEFELIKFTNSQNLIAVAQHIKQLKPDLSYWSIGKSLYFAYHQAQAIDEIEAQARVIVGFEVEKGSCERLLRQFLSDLGRTSSKTEVEQVKAKYSAKLNAIPTHRPEQVLRVGIVGEIYMVMEPFSNFFIEKELAQYGMEVHRFLTMSGAIYEGFRYQKVMKHILTEADPYLHNLIGAHASESVARTHSLAKQGFDGVIHVKPFGCMPEINAMPALHHISHDYNMPIIYFSFDTLTSETGIKTRLEAFYDMLIMKKEREISTGFTS